MKIRCLLVDDEPPALKVLLSHISKVNGIDVVGTCKSSFEAFNMLNEQAIDLIFLDIKMPTLNGIDFLRNLSNPPKVIFVTAYREFAVDGFELDVIDYLVKPVSFERFLKAVSRVKTKFGLEVNLQREEFIANPVAFLYLKVNKSLQKVFVNEILYVESWKDYVKLFLADGTSIIVKQSISSIENLLSVHSFLRVHRSYLVAIKKISAYSNMAIQINDANIPIGRLYKQRVMEIIQRK